MNIRFKQRFVIPVVVSVVVLTTSAFKNDFFEIAKQIEIFTTLFKELNTHYVDETNPAELMNTAIKSMLNELDPYTKFYNEQDVEAERIRRTGDYTGIGASIRTLKDKLVVVEPYKGYPADKAGLKAGDQVIAIDGKAISSFKDDASELLQGAANSSFNVTYMRQGKQHNATLTRSEVDIDAVPFFGMLNANTGYVALTRFNQKTTSQTTYAIKDLKAQGATKLVLDLRSNPGGLLSEAVNIVNLFVPKGQLVVTTKSKIKKFNKTYFTKKAPLDLDIPLVVLINGKSASASEIVSGSLQDLDRAVIVGARSFGKGLVQRPKKLNYGTQLKVTISRYYTPSGRCIQALDYANRDKDGNATRIASENYNAFKTKNGRQVFDGGGVMPDVVVKNAKGSPLTKAIEKNFSVFDYATNYYYNNTFDDINTFEFSEADFNDFKRFLKATNFNFKTQTEKALDIALKQAKDETIEQDIASEYNALLGAINRSKMNAIDDYKPYLKHLLTDEIVKRYAYAEGLYKYNQTHDEVVLKAETILDNPETYKSYLK